MYITLGTISVPFVGERKGLSPQNQAFWTPWKLTIYIYIYISPFLAGDVQ
jgi:hypothetical protein